MDSIKTKGLKKYYGKSRGIDNIDLAVAEGDFFGFIGPNGAGKSTTIRTLLGLIHPTAGTASVNGMDIVKDSVRLRETVGYLPSETIFYRGMRVGEIIKLSAKLRGLDCSKEAETLCSRLQLDTTKKVEALSFGNRKKLGIVCALQHKPKLYILDEPTSGLDPLIQRTFFDILSERNHEGATVFLSSHVLSEIQRHCRRAAIIREGRLVASGPVEELSKTSAKRVSLHGIENLDELSQLQNADIKDVQSLSDGVSFLYTGDINVLLHSISQLRLTDLSISEPDLEEIFMHYYSDGGETK